MRAAALIGSHTKGEKKYSDHLFLLACWVVQSIAMHHK